MSEMSEPEYYLHFEMPGQGEHWYEIRRASDDRRVASIGIEFEAEAHVMLDALHGMSRDEAVMGVQRENTRLRDIIGTQAVELSKRREAT